MVEEPCTNGPRRVPMRREGDICNVSKHCVITDLASSSGKNFGMLCPDPATSHRDMAHDSSREQAPGLVLDRASRGITMSAAFHFRNSSSLGRLWAVHANIRQLHYLTHGPLVIDGPVCPNRLGCRKPVWQVRYSSYCADHF